MTSANFGFEKSKVIQALRYHFITRSEIKYMLILVNIFALVSAALFYFKKVSPLAFMMGSFIWVSLMVIFWFVLPQLVYRKSYTFKDRFQAVFNKDGLQLSNDRSSNSWEWKQFTTWMESPHFFHMYLNEKAFFIIPKSAFLDEETVNIRKLCVERLGKRSK